MKLKEGFITTTIGGEKYIIAANGTDFRGIAHCNEAAALIVEYLKIETSEETLLKNMLKEYNVSEEILRTDVKAVLEKLRAMGAIEDSYHPNRDD